MNVWLRNGMIRFVLVIVVFIKDGEMCSNLLFSFHIYRIATIVSYKIIVHML